MLLFFANQYNYVKEYESSILFFYLIHYYENFMLAFIVNY
jgi:hypothetical protein